MNTSNLLDANVWLALPRAGTFTRERQDLWFE